MSVADSMPKQFSHKESEQRIYAMWEEKKVFEAEVDRSKKPFCVVIPPPNVTGILHMGHVLDNTPQDIMTRWHRMRGYSAVWIPGTDHAGIATQNVVKRQLEKEGVDMRDLGREEFLKRVWAWKEKSGNTIIQQLKRLGCSCDWRRERFTMDDGLVSAVLEAFVRLFKKGLIYRGKRMVNWCTVCGTALSDDEVEYANQGSHLWHFKYPLVDDAGNVTGESVVVATTRPETMLGDTAVAVHPDDERYTQIVGRRVLLPLKNRLIPIIADPFVDPKFGTGVVKLTPAHDPNDYAAGKTHNLEVDVVIGLDGKMTESAGDSYKGLDRYAARKKVVEALESGGFVEKIEKHSHAVSQCYRCKSVLEPMISDQWFVKMRPLAEKAKEVVANGTLPIVPDSEKHDYFHWMDTIQDWCISRQLWWGHRIPVYYCDDCDHIMSQVETPHACDACGSAALRQDEDVLDTWFSSQLWPFSTLGWPKETPELKYWYPNTWLMSGRDILFFWDARMIMSGLELMGEIPFRTLVLHGLVRDSQGRKLSKSLNNSPDPLDLFDQYGADAVRAAIAMNYPLGRQDTKLSDELFKNGQGLVIKLWNAARLLLSNLEEGGITFNSQTDVPEALEDRWIVSRLAATIEMHDMYLNKNDIVHAISTVTQFFWNDFCDWYLELIKPRLWAGGDSKNSALKVSMQCERTLLKLLHPYIPFVTEELWQILRQNRVVDSASTSNESALAISQWPQSSELRKDNAAEAQIDLMISIVRGLRDVRHHLLLSPKAELSLLLDFIDQSKEGQFATLEGVAKRIGVVSEFSKGPAPSSLAGMVPFKFDGGIGYVTLPPDVDGKDLSIKLSSRIEKLQKALAGIHNNLKNEQFIKNAPQALVDETKGKARELEESISKLEQFKRSVA
jgi:valyl-tRNA synthetase